MPNAKKNTSPTTKETKLTISRFLKAPLRILVKARDFYVRSLTECSGHVGYGTVLGCPTGQINTTLPKSFSVRSGGSSSHVDDEAFRELVRAASARSLSKKVESDLFNKKQPIIISGTNKMSRSFSTGIGRIDEDKPCDFAEDVVVKAHVYVRSRSCAPSDQRTSRLSQAG